MYRLSLHTCNLGTATRPVTNPFTGERLQVPVDDGLTQSERESVNKLLTRARASLADPDGYRTVILDDATKINIGIGTLDCDNPCVALVAEVDRFSFAAVSFLFTLARAGNLSVGSSIDPDVIALTQPAQNERVAKRWPTAAIVTTAVQLMAWLEKCRTDGRVV